MNPKLTSSNLGALLFQHTLPSFTVPPHKDGTVYPLPCVVYRMFDYTDVPEVSREQQP